MQIVKSIKKKNFFKEFYTLNYENYNSGKLIYTILKNVIQNLISLW